jgi:hypothetical protein
LPPNLSESSGSEEIVLQSTVYCPFHDLVAPILVNGVS